LPFASGFPVIKLLFYTFVEDNSHNGKHNSKPIATLSYIYGRQPNEKAILFPSIPMASPYMISSVAFTRTRREDYNLISLITVAGDFYLLPKL
jgi:hypothetical protein